MGLNVGKLPNLRLLGRCVVVCGVLWSAQWLTTWDTSVLPFIGIHANTWFYTLGGVALLLTGRRSGIRWSSEDWFVRTFICIGLGQIAIILTSKPEWFGFGESVWWPGFFASSSAHDGVLLGLNFLWVMSAVAFLYFVQRRVRMLPIVDRVAVKPVAIGFCIVGAVGGLTSEAHPFPGPMQSQSSFLISLTILSIPVGTVIAVATFGTFRRALATRYQKQLTSRPASESTAGDDLGEILHDVQLESASHFVIRNDISQQLKWMADLASENQQLRERLNSVSGTSRVGSVERQLRALDEMFNDLRRSTPESQVVNEMQQQLRDVIVELRSTLAARGSEQHDA